MGGWQINHHRSEQSPGKKSVSDRTTWGPQAEKRKRIFQGDGDGHVIQKGPKRKAVNPKNGEQEQGVKRILQTGMFL